MQRPAIEQQVTFLVTTDLAATAVFYETILQLPLALDQGVCRIMPPAAMPTSVFARR
ncbi:MAG TPA: hypothetical protein PLD25_16700 [Chloroflexota bacterium]|nr:hypothetical protein [Chloroflexota bacterium]HUM69950.1 hypothetical protein [Chloroflexota bacterium]